MQRKGFTLLELLIVMSIIVLLLSILLPCLMTAKDSALELFAMQVEADEDGKVFMEIRDLSHRESYDGIYIIKIDPPGNCSVILKRPHPPGMKLIKKDGEDHIKWRPKVENIGVHFITVVFESEKTSEQELTVYVYNKELLDAKREEILDAD